MDSHLGASSPMYQNETQSLEPGESTTVRIGLALVEEYLESVDKDVLCNRTFYGILFSHDEESHCDRYHLAFHPDSYVEATAEEKTVYEDAMRAVNEEGRQELAQNAAKKSETGNTSSACYTYLELEIHNYDKEPHTFGNEQNASFACHVVGEKVPDEEEELGYFYLDQVGYYMYLADLSKTDLPNYQNSLEIPPETTVRVGVCYYAGLSAAREDWIFVDYPRLLIVDDVMEDPDFVESPQDQAENYAMILLNELEVR